MVSAPFPARRARGSARTATVLGKDYREAPYRPKFAIGIMCRDEEHQQRLHRSLVRRMPAADIRVLVI
jgi:hypothetical protein